MKFLVFSAHASDMLEERGIDVEWVRATVAEPERQDVDPKHPDRVRLYRRIPEHEGRWLRVVCVEAANEVRIVTAFFDRRAGVRR